MCVGKFFPSLLEGQATPCKGQIIFKAIYKLAHFFKAGIHLLIYPCVATHGACTYYFTKKRLWKQLRS